MLHAAWATRWAIATLVLAGAGAAGAATDCSVQSLQALKVPKLTVTTAKLVPAAATRPAYCDVQGMVATEGEGAGPGSAGFALSLPANWSGRYMFGGGRGTGGNLASSANKPDIDGALAKGYASATTDSGHSGREENWYYVGKPGVPNVPKLTDYYYRATHQVTLVTRELVKAYYGAASIKRAYFNGCSNGGRQAITEAVRYPEDYDGIIVGCPWLDPAGSALLNVQRSKSFLAAANHIPLDKFTEIDAAVLARCDQLDGVRDGLIQNPGACDFDPHSIVPRILTNAQADALDHYLDAVRDDKGHLVHPGSSVARLQAQFNGVRNNPDGTPLRAMLYEQPAPFPLAPAPWGEGKNESHNWNSARGVIQDLAFNDESFDLNNDIFQKNSTVKPALLKSLYDKLSPEIVADPASLLPFLKRGGKVLIYHGLSDVTINGFGTILYYQALADQAGSYDKLQEQVRLFLVSGMQHCNDGPDPVFFDTLTAMEEWVEDGVAPNAMTASYTENWGKKVTRTLPLCKFPEQARFSGSGDVNDAKNWNCPAGDQGMLQVGRNGAQAGMKDDRARYTARFKGMPAATMPKRD